MSHWSNTPSARVARLDHKWRMRRAFRRGKKKFPAAMPASARAAAGDTADTNKTGDTTHAL